MTLTPSPTSNPPQRFLEVAHHTVSWFWGRLQADELDMRPPFQRNPVWQDQQKAYLIDSILRGLPVPELYIQTNVNSSGEENHIIVDGQQRIRACLEFLSNKFPLGDKSENLAGLTFEQLSESDRRRIFEYKFVVRVLPDLSNERLREIFGRLNLNNIALNRQEMRHATYWGDFISCMEELSKKPFWVNSGIFSANDFRRMIDVEYVSELTIGILFGPQNKKSNLDDYYASFEEEFPDRSIVEGTFDSILGELDRLITWPNKLRWSRKVDFYSLFLTLADRVDDFPLNREDRQKASRRLVEFSNHVNDLVMSSDRRPGSDEDTDTRAAAYARSIRNSSDLGSRRTRIAALDAFLRDQPISFEPSPARARDPLRSLPSPEVLMSRSSEVVDRE